MVIFWKIYIVHGRGDSISMVIGIWYKLFSDVWVAGSFGKINVCLNSGLLKLDIYKVGILLVMHGC